MDSIVESAPLSEGVRLQGFVIERLLVHERYVNRYAARDAEGRAVTLVEFFPSETVLRVGGMVVTRDREEQEAFRAWSQHFFERAQRLAALSHPNLVRVRQVFEANGTAYYTTELIGGEPLAATLERETTLPEPRLRRMLVPVIQALAQAHAADLLHGDIEPGKLWLQSDGTAVLADFAAFVAPVRLRGRTVLNTGTPGYAAPEHSLVQAATSPPSDIYSLAAVAYRALCGEAPPETRLRGAGVELRPAAIAARGRCSRALSAAIDAALALRPQQRPQTLDTWRLQLESEEAAPVAMQPAPGRPAGGISRRMIAVPAALVLLAGIYFVAVRVVAPPHPAHQPQGNAAIATPGSPRAPSPPTVIDTGNSRSASLDQLAAEMMQQEMRARTAQADASVRRPAAPQPAASTAPAVAASTEPAPTEPAPTEAASKGIAPPATGAATPRQLEAAAAPAPNVGATPAPAPPPAAAARPPAVAPQPVPARKIVSGISPEYQNLIKAMIGRKLSYPRNALIDRDEGVVTMTVRLSPDGTLLSAEVTRGSGFRALDEEARAVFLRIGRFPPVPGAVPGVEEYDFEFPINFSLTN